MLNKKYLMQCPLIWVRAWIELFESIVTILTFGLIRSCLSLKFMVWGAKRSLQKKDL